MLIYLIIYVWFFYDIYYKLGGLILEEKFNLKKLFSKEVIFFFVYSLQCLLYILYISLIKKLFDRKIIKKDK